MFISFGTDSYLEMYRSKNIVKYSSPMQYLNLNQTLIIAILKLLCILERILTLDPNLILPEQFNPITNEYFSAKKLTWNYSELYNLYNLLN